MVDLPKSKLLTTLAFPAFGSSVAIEFFAVINMRIVFVNGLESTS